MKTKLTMILIVALMSALFIVPLVRAQTIDPTQCAAETTAPQAVETDLDELLASFIDPNSPNASISGYAPGAVFLIDAPDWRYYKAAGVVDVASREPINCEMPFQIGSNTKMMTATVLLQLQEEGKLNINDPLSKYLPDYAAALPFGDQMTLRQLATHTSGVFSYTDNAPNGVPGIMEGDLTDAEALAQGYTPDELIQFVIANGQPNFEPGAEGQWFYSNTGFVLLGIIIEQITGQPLADVFRERIFEPLDMNDTFLWNDVPQPEFGLPSSYFQAPFDVETTNWNMSQGWAAGAVISTAEDMTKFMRGLLKGELFQDDATLALMMDGVKLNNGQFVQYGIGLAEKLTGVWGHGGQTLGFESDTGYVLENDVSIVVWTNAAKDQAAVGAQLVDQVLVSAGVAVDPNQVAAEAMASQLRSTEWQWKELKILGEGGTTTPIPNPASYTALFNEDGSVNFKADCNRAGGSYTIDGYDMSLAMGPMTLAACPPESLSDQYLQNFGGVSGFSIDGKDLQLIGTLDDKVFMMRFEPVAAELKLNSEIVGVTWQWQELQSMDDTITTVSDPANYTLLLNPDGTFNIQADCNQGGGGYTLNGSQLALEVGPLTRAACPPESLSDRYIELLGSVASYVIEDGELYLSLMADGGILRFSPADN